MNRWIDDTRADVACGVRGFAARPGVPAVAVLTLAIGIAASTAILSAIDSVFLTPLSYPAGDRLVVLWERRPTGERNALSTRSYLAYAGEGGVFERVAPTVGPVGGIALTGGDHPVLLRGFRVGVEYFDILGTKAWLGRTFRRDDERGGTRVVVLSHGLGAAQFGSDRNLIGRSILLNGEPHTVIGVMPADGPFDRSWVQLWLPLAIDDAAAQRTDHWLASLTGGALALLKPGVSIDQARAALDVVSSRLARVYPDTNTGWSVEIQSFASALVGEDLRRSLYLLVAAVGCLLLLACVNLAHLLTARGVDRAPELTIRAALGAGRGRLVRQFLTESILLSSAGGLLGVVLAYVLLPTALAALPPYTFPAEAVITIDARVLVFVATLSVVTGVGCGVFPAVWLTRRQPRTDPGFRYAFVVSEVALATVLVIAAGLLVRSFVNMRQDDGGIGRSDLVMAYLPVRSADLASSERLVPYYRRLIEAIGSQPELDAVALSDGLPFQGVTRSMFFQVSGRQPVERSRRPLTLFKAVSGSYFDTLSLRMRQGRALDERDRAGSGYVTVINETMARRYFPGQSPVGEHLLMQQTRPGSTEEIAWEVVGVVADERVMPFSDKQPYDAAYVPLEQSPAAVIGVVVRTRLEPAQAEAAIRRAVFSVNRSQPVTDVESIEAIKADSMVSDRLRSIALSAFAIVAMVLSGIGLFGMVRYAVERRTREFGIRSALGASGRQLATLAMYDGVAATAMGLLVGVFVASGATRVLRILLYGVAPSDPISIAVAVAILMAVALAACYLPARRARNVDPATALRHT